jgi:predicted 2-oxoglutarate/Fe(II)-dependent dioxygenase YbiX
MPLLPGIVAPDFQTPGVCNPKYAFNTVAGRPIVMAFLGEPGNPQSHGLVEVIRANRRYFDDDFASVFYFVRGPDDLAAFGLADDYPGVRCLYDPNRAIARMYALSSPSGEFALPAVVALDRQLRVTLTQVRDQSIEGFAQALRSIAALRDWRAKQRSLGHAPVLIAEWIFDLPLCRALIDYYKTKGGARSGFMREVNGITTGIHDDAMKRRSDCTIDDDRLRRAVHTMMKYRLAPLIKQAFHFDATRIERDIVACYDSAVQGFFRAHRDNTSKGTAHRKFAVTINLNTEEYDGGDLRFPEFGSATYRAPTGGAVVFSGSLLHEALPMTRGVRYAYLPFLYGEADALVRQEGENFLDIESGGKAVARPADSLPSSLGHFGLVDDDPIY